MHTTDFASVRRFSVKRVKGSSAERIVDAVAAEEPLEIRILYWFKDDRRASSLAVTMRTPGQDRELAAGLLLSEGVIRNREQLVDVRALGNEPSNEVIAELSKDVDFEGWRLARTSFVNSSCGICGKRSREEIARQLPKQEQDQLVVEASLIEKLPEFIRERQAGFAETGGLHGAAVVTPCGDVEEVFEDIGRHNALDKLIGSRVLAGRIPLTDRVLFMSSRSSFELIQKAAMAGAPFLASVGGPSSLAIETARELGITLIGFVRDGRFNIYSGEWRINS